MPADPVFPVPRPTTWPYRADRPRRYWGNYKLYQVRGGLVRLEDDIKGFTAGDRGVGDISRFYFFCVAFDQMIKEGITGHVAELGAYRGNTASVLAAIARRMNTTAWILDTFEGFNPNDLQGIDASHRAEFDDTSLEAVRALVGEQNVQYVKGHFPDSARLMPDDLSFCLVHIDCDLYVPIVHALDYFYPRLVPGGYLIIHDYGSLDWDGAEKAVDEFFADKPEAVIPLPDGFTSVAIRKARASTGGDNWLIRQRCAKFSETWTSAGLGGLAPLLGSGWSDSKSWGVWGVGATHTLHLYMQRPPATDLVVEVDGAAALVGPRRSQEVDVFAAGRHVATWQFSVKQNRAARSSVVPAEAWETGDWGLPLLRLEFRPKEVTPINELDPTKPDSRALGLALFRLRRATR